MALSNPDPAAALADDRLHQILDLCLMCKACKSECPLGVDIAALKSEALSHYYDVHGVPLRARIFGSIRTLNRLGAATAPLSNLSLRSRTVRALMGHALGIAPERPLPAFKRPTLVRWFAHQRESVPDGRQGQVTFVADSFTTFTEPNVGAAAIDLLQRAGWSVRLESRGCCGRASLSKGLIEDARKKASRLAALLAESSQPGGPIVGCEPSCLFTLREENLALPPDSRVRDLAGRIRQIEELILEAIDDGRLVLQNNSWLAGRRLMYHPHCHQRAEVGAIATVALLRQIPGAEVIELDAGCCGMAGSFGFEIEHYNMSMAIGESRLFPSINAASADTLVAASGVSCRQQIRHGTGRETVHPLELVHSVIVDR
jgi:Fe-S oxidoreductase